MKISTLAKTAGLATILSMSALAYADHHESELKQYQEEVENTWNKSKDASKEMAEDTEEAMEDAMENTEDAMEDAKENTEDAMEDTGNQVEDWCEDAKESADAKDTDC